MRNPNTLYDAEDTPRASVCNENIDTVRQTMSYCTETTRMQQSGGESQGSSTRRSRARSGIPLLDGFKYAWTLSDVRAGKVSSAGMAMCCITTKIFAAQWR